MLEELLMSLSWQLGLGIGFRVFVELAKEFKEGRRFVDDVERDLVINK